VAPFDDAAFRGRLEWTSGDLIAFRVGVSHEGSARPAEVIAALAGEAVAADTDYARLALHGDGGKDPLSLAEFRTAPGASRTAAREEAAAPAS